MEADLAAARAADVVEEGAPVVAMGVSKAFLKQAYEQWMGEPCEIVTALRDVPAEREGARSALLELAKPVDESVRVALGSALEAAAALVEEAPPQENHSWRKGGVRKGGLAHFFFCMHFLRGS